MNPKVVAVIPAREGSKRLPEKNSIDIDTLEDFEEAERIILKRLEND